MRTGYLVDTDWIIDHLSGVTAVTTRLTELRPAANEVFIPSSKIYVAASLPPSDPQRPVIERFVADYEKRYGRKPATFAGNGYDSVMMLVAAIRSAGADREKIREALEGLRGYVGVTALYTYSSTDHFGAYEESVVMLQVRGGVSSLPGNSAGWPPSVHGARP